MQLTKTTQDGRLKLVRSKDWIATNTLLLDVVPDLFGWIKLGRIRGKKKDFKLSAERPNALFNHTRMVRRMPVPNQKDRILGIIHQPLQKITNPLGIHGSFDHHKAHMPERADSRNHIQAKACSRGLDHGGLTDRSPGFSRMKIRAYSRFIFKVYAGPTLFGFFLYLRKDLFLPLGNGLWILLIGAVKGFLSGKPQLSEKPPDRTLTQSYPEFVFDGFSDQAPGPQRKGKLELAGVSLANQEIDPPDLRAVQFSRPSRAFAAFKGVPASGTVPGKPVVDAGSDKAQCFDDNFRAYARLDALLTGELKLP